MDRSTTSAAVAGALAALVGGLLWVLAWIGVGGFAWWPGAVLLVLAAVAVGAGLVDRGATPLRVVVGVCLAVLGWALLTVVGGVVGTGGSERVDGIAGAVLAALGAVVVGRALRGRGDRPAEPDAGRGAGRPAPGRRRTGGAHAG
ncbi:hypothetical protein I601_1837 [Nocardioides dokdonensis FR1436]|uniref:Uncharacterized protein n=1 Tax=Nocardioides dokdonensis FR1436 TaxID=1300347 RepID=A0A1A9GJ32_9ACTN|nr:hypothetical protein [Nocardioides dokdonensis]ANH38268.1 hypothetical protein I601_1837 [Nocardioides dokdonensis FR1436]